MRKLSPGVPRARKTLVFAATALLIGLLLCGCQQRAAAPVPAATGYCPPVNYTMVPAPVVVAETPVWRPIAGRTVILDPGHGGDDEGTAHFGLREKDINLDLAQRAAQMLRARGVVVHMTRTSDVFVPLPQRSAFANRYPDAILVSVHVNASASNPLASGIETFVLSKEFKDEDRGREAQRRYKVNGAAAAPGGQALADLATRSRAKGPALAGALQKSLVSRLDDADRGVKTANLAVLRETYFCPAVLVEVGFLTHIGTAARMRTGEWRQRTAEALCEGIADYLRQPD